MATASDSTLAVGLLLFSYPLHPPRRPTELRTHHFPHIQTPTLFVHGTRDGFGSISEMEEARTQIPAKNELLPVQGAGHDLITASNRTELPPFIAKTFLAFVGSSQW
jgi:uncharacterized protein